MQIINARISVSPLAIVVVLSCLAAPRSSTTVQIPKEWARIDLAHFTFYAPPDIRDQNVHGIDSMVWQFRNSKMTLNLDYGMYSNDLESYKASPEYHAEWVQIDGKRAKIATLQMNPPDGPNKDRSYAAAVYFPEVDGSRTTKLTMWASCVDQATRDSTTNIFLSIRFK